MLEVALQTQTAHFGQLNEKGIITVPTLNNFMRINN